MIRPQARPNPLLNPPDAAATSLVGTGLGVACLLEDWQFSPELLHVVRKMKPTRQVECAELMVSANSLKVVYADALLAATLPELLVDGRTPRKLSGVTNEQMARMEREMSNFQGQDKLIEQITVRRVATAKPP